MYAINKFIQKVQIFSLRTNAILEYFRNALLLSCMVLLFVEGIARRNKQPRMPERIPEWMSDGMPDGMPDGIPITRPAVQMYRRVLSMRARYEIDVLPAIPEEEGGE
ncbi:hypothetical protein ACJ73_01713 [Blastomyces percursus]|uniref:Uncharacterized protein n=1 Tax=Blastomyces percursus TaxID=1658174 RepID=A0A1J9QDJ8_9EURO|nr:hypothetical protein ACJ73_01713 [Blastomyces percursus]